MRALFALLCASGTVSATALFLFWNMHCLDSDTYSVKRIGQFGQCWQNDKYQSFKVWGDNASAHLYDGLTPRDKCGLHSYRESLALIEDHCYSGFKQDSMCVVGTSSRNQWYIGDCAVPKVVYAEEELAKTMVKMHRPKGKHLDGHWSPHEEPRKGE